MKPRLQTVKPSQPLIEIEKKFKLRHGDEQKIAKIARFVGEKKMIDRYLDTKDYFLTTRDLWMRNRDSRYELKVPMDMLVKSKELESIKVEQYQELETEPEIQNFLSSRFPRFNTSSNSTFSDYLKKCELDIFGTIITTRRKYQTEDVTIDLDLTDYGYAVGEVEILVENDKQIVSASQRIDEFCKRLGLEMPPMQGKVLEYIQYNRPDHYQVLLSCGLINKRMA